MEIKVRNLEEVRQSLLDVPDNAADQAKDAFRTAVLGAHAKIVRNLSGNPMESRTGLLRRSIRTDVTGSTLENLKASVYSAGSVAGTPVVYAPIHEYGGTIRAKNAYRNVPGGPYLNIPTDDNQTAAGVQRYTAKQVFDRGGYIAKLRGHNRYGVFMDDDMMFFLTKSVEIPARLGMRDAADEQIPGLLDDIRSITI